MKKIAIAALVAAGLAGLAATPAAAGGTATGTFQLRATVPMACWVRPVEGAMLADEGQGGTVVEACNNPGGYTITANYRMLDTGERASMQYGERALALPASGEAVLRRSHMADINTVQYRFRDVQLQQPLVMALTISPM